MTRRPGFSALLSTLFATCLLTAGTSASAAPWTASYATCANDSVVATPGNFGTCGGSGVEVRATSIIDSVVVDSTVTGWSSGLGVRNPNESDTTGPHALDNYLGLDALIFRFAQAVSLTSFTLGWNGTDNSTGRYDDSDVSVFAWTGAEATPTTFGSTGPGWTLIGNYLDVGVGSNTENVLTDVFSNHWLISAFGVGSRDSASAFKVLTLAGNTMTPPPDEEPPQEGEEPPPDNEVPEPGSLALLAIGAMGLLAARRRVRISRG